MFKIINNTIHMTRGDWGVIDFSIPMTKTINNIEYLEYEDNEGNIYLYDYCNKKPKLYDVYLKPVSISIDTLTLLLHAFKKDDVIRFRVFKADDVESVEIQKDVIIETETTHVDIELTKDLTKIGGYIDEPVDYWYEIEVNPDTKPQTVVGYDDVSAKIFRLYPEGGDKNATS